MGSEMDEKTIEKIEKNWVLYRSLVSKIKNEDTRKSLEGLCEELTGRLSTAPASTRTDFTGAYPGGLVQHSLNVLRLAKNLNKVFSAGVSTDSLIITSLFHDLGKVGNKETEHYIEQKSDWHRDRGMMYEIAPESKGAQVSQRTIWWLNNFGVKLTEDEISAISSLSDMGQMYSSELYSSPMLNILLQTAVRVACVQGTGKTNVCD